MKKDCKYCNDPEGTLYSYNMKEAKLFGEHLRHKNLGTVADYKEHPRSESRSNYFPAD